MMHGDEDEIIKKLKELLEKAVRECCKEKTGIIFSGGLDSGILAILAKDDSNLVAYSAGIKESKDIENVRKLKDKVNFKIIIREFDLEEVKKDLSKILKAMPDKRTNPIQVGCAIPLYFVSQEAKKDKIKIMLSGQGGDELFGGYNRYLRYLDNLPKLEKILRGDVESAYQDNLNRDLAICASNGITLKFPFMNKDLVNFALKIPTNLKIKEVDKEEFSCIDQINDRKFIRKYILRKVAQEVNVPEIILNRPKKALQYGSGSWKILKKIARDGGFRSKSIERDSYVEQYLESLNLN